MSPDQTSSSITLTRNSIVEEARTYIDVPFKHQGRLRSGIDCIGLVILVAKHFGIVEQEFEDTNYPRRSPHSQAFIDRFKAKLIQKPNNKMQPGDVVILKADIFPCHCGIIGERNGELTVIHAYAARRKVLEEYFLASEWDKQHVATFEFPGIK